MTTIWGWRRRAARAPGMMLLAPALIGLLTIVPTTTRADVFVNAAATGANNGTSWEDAFTDLQIALWSPLGTVHVAEGVYEPLNLLSPDDDYWWSVYYGGGFRTREINDWSSPFRRWTVGIYSFHFAYDGTTIKGGIHETAPAMTFRNVHRKTIRPYCKVREAATTSSSATK